MHIIIKTKNLELTPSLENLIQKRMAVSQKMINAFQESTSFLVEVEKETRHHRKGDIFKAEVIVSLPGKKLVAKAHGENLSRVITEVKNELEREIRKYKTKTIELPRRKYRKSKRENII